MTHYLGATYTFQLLLVSKYPIALNTESINFFYRLASTISSTYIHYVIDLRIYIYIYSIAQIFRQGEILICFTLYMTTQSITAPAYVVQTTSIPHFVPSGL